MKTLTHGIDLRTTNSQRTLKQQSGTLVTTAVAHSTRQATPDTSSLHWRQKYAVPTGRKERQWSMLALTEAVAKRTPSRRIWRPICERIPERNPSSVDGRAVDGSSPGLMSWPDTTESTPGTDLFGVDSANDRSPGPIICHCTWNDTRIREAG